MSDGTLIFDTALDPSGFDKGAEKLIQAVTKILGQAKGASVQIKDSLADALKADADIQLDPKTFDQYMDSLKSRVTSIGDQIGKAYQKATTTKNFIQADSSVDQMEALLQQLLEAKKRLQDLGGVQIVSSEYAELKKKLADINAEIAKNRAERDKITSQPKGLATEQAIREKQLSKIDTQYKDQAFIRDSIEKKMQAMEASMAGNDFGEITKDYQDVKHAIDAIGFAYNDLVQKANAARNALALQAQAQAQAKAQAQAVQQQTQQYRLQAQQARVAQVQSQTANQQQIAQARTQAIQQQAANQQQIAQARATATQLNAISQQQARQQTANAQAAATQQVAAARAAAQQQVADARSQAIQQTAQTQNAIRQAQAMQRAIGGLLSGIGNVISGTISNLERIGSAAVRAGSTIVNSLGNMARNALNGLLGVFQRLGSAIGSLASGIGSRISGAFQNLTKSAKKATPSVNDLVKKLISFQTMLVRRFKRTFITYLFKDIQNSIQALAKHSSTFNKSMSSMQNSMSMMGANGVVAFGNLVNAVAPFVTAIVNALSTAITYLNAFFAMLSGKSVMTVAKQQTKSFGASAGGAAKKVKELKNEVYGFDELNKRTKQNDDDSSGGGGSGVTDIYEDVKVSDVLPEELMDYFEKIKEAIGEENWREVGGLIADGMNYVIYQIDQAIIGIHDKVVEWTENLAIGLNGFVERLDWGLIGQTIAHGLNLAIDVGNTFLTTFDFTVLGEGLGKSLNSLVMGLDWPGLGQLFANGFNSAANFLYGAVTKFNWRNLGLALSDGVNNFFGAVNWPQLGNTAAATLNGIFALFKGFAEGSHWAQWGTNIGSAVTAFFNGTEWDQAGQAVNLWVDGICTTLKTLTENTEMWESIRTGIAKLTKSLFDDKNIGKALESVGNFVSRVFTTLGLIIGDTPWNKLADGVATGLNGVFDADKSAELGAAWRGAIDAVLDGAYTFVTKFDWSGAADAVSAFANELFDIDWTKLVFSIGLGIGGIATTITLSIEQITEKLPGYASQIADGVNKIFGSDENGESYIKWDEIGQAFGDSIVNILNGLATFIKGVKWKQIGEDLGTLLKNIPWKDIAKKMWEVFKETLKATFNLVEGISNALSGNVEAELSVTPKWQLSNSNDMYTAFDNARNGIVDSISPWIQDYRKELREASGSLGQELIDGFKSSVDNGKTDFTDSIGELGYLAYNGFVDNFKSDKAVAAVTNFFTDLSHIEDAEQLKAKFSEYGYEISYEFADSLGRAGVENLSLATALLNKGVSEEVLGKLDLTQLSGMIETYMQETGRTFDQVAQELMSGSSQLLQEVYAQKVSDLTGIAYAMAHGIQEEIDAASPELQASGNALLENLYNAETAAEIKQAFADAGVVITGEFAKSISGQGQDNIIAALALLGNGIDEETIRALDLSNLDKNLNTYMDQTGASIQEVAGQLATNTGETIGKILPEAAASGAQEALSNVTDAADTVVETLDISESAPQLQTNSETAGEGVTEGAGQGIDKNIKKVDKPVENLVKAIDKPMEELTPEERTQVETMMQAIQTAIAQGNPVVEETMKTAAEAVLAKAAEYLNEKEGKKITDAFMDAIKTSINTKKTPLVTEMLLAMTEVHDTAKNILSEFNGTTIATAFSNGIHAGIDLLKDLPEIVGGVMNSLSDEMYDTLEDMANGVKGAISRLSDSVASSFRSLGESAASALRSKANYNVGYSAGSNVVAGLKAGLASGKADVSAAGAEIGDATAQGTKDALEIASPSKVFRQIGEYVMEGFALGIEGTSGDALKAVATTAKAMQDEANGDQLTMSMNTTVSGLDAVAEKLSGIATIFDRISSAISSMGDRAFPDIAMGTVLPYRTRVESTAQDTQAPMTEAFTRMAADQTEVMEDQRDLIRELINTVQGLRLTLDVDTMTNAVTARQKTLSRNAGTVVI